MTYDLVFESEPWYYSMIIYEILMIKSLLYRENLEKMVKKEKKGV